MSKRKEVYTTKNLDLPPEPTREEERQRIEQETQEFLSNGNKIQFVDIRIGGSDKWKGTVWRNNSRKRALALRKRTPKSPHNV